MNPSPNMRSLPAAIAYPGFGALEGTSLSVGRGTGRAFTLYGAPWVDASLAERLNAAGLEGVAFKSVTFTPKVEPGFPVYPHSDKVCRGIEIEIRDRRAFRPVRGALRALELLHRLHPKEFTFAKACAMIGRQGIEADIKAGVPPERIEAGWAEETAAWALARRKHFLYK